MTKLLGNGGFKNPDAMVGPFVGGVCWFGGIGKWDGADGCDHAGDHGVDGAVVDVRGGADSNCLTGSDCAFAIARGVASEDDGGTKLWASIDLTFIRGLFSFEGNGA